MELIYGCPFFLVSILCMVQLSQASVTVSLNFFTYNNPTRKDYYGAPCDFFSHCDQFFHICVDKHLGSDSISAEDQCAYYENNTGVYPQWNNIVFTHDLHGLRNPIVFTVPQWEGGILLKIGVWDADSFPRRNERVDFIVYRYGKIPTSRKGMPGSSEFEVLSGRRPHDSTSLTVNITTYCSDHHSTKHDICDSHCKPTDNARGHYNCTVLGDKVCLPGWEDVYSDCTKSVNDCPDNHSCKNGGVCVDDHQTYKCECPPSFKGPVCDDATDYCDKNPCANGLFCESKKDGSYQCKAKPPVLSANTQEQPISPLIIGLIVGILLFVIIVVLLVALLWSQRRKRRLKNQGTNAVAHTSNMGQQTRNQAGTASQTSPNHFPNSDAVYQNQMNGAFAASSQTQSNQVASTGTNTVAGAKSLEAALLSSMPPPYKEREYNVGRSNQGGFNNPSYDPEEAPERPPPRGSTNRNVGAGTSAGGAVGRRTNQHTRGHPGAAGNSGSEGALNVKALADLYEKPISTK